MIARILALPLGVQEKKIFLVFIRRYKCKCGVRQRNIAPVVNKTGKIPLSLWCDQCQSAAVNINDKT